MIETTSRICHKFAVTPVFAWSRKQALLLHFSVFHSLCLFSPDILCLGDLFASHLFCCFPLPWTWPSRMLPFVRDSRCQQHPIRLYRKAALTAAAVRLAVRVTRSSQTLRPLLEQGQGNTRRGRAFFTLPLLAFLLLFLSRQPAALLRCSRALARWLSPRPKRPVLLVAAQVAAVTKMSCSCRAAWRALLSKAERLHFLMQRCPEMGYFCFLGGPAKKA